MASNPPASPVWPAAQPAPAPTYAAGNPGFDAPLPPAEDFSYALGRGVRGTLDGRSYVLGNHRLVHELGLCTPALEARLDALEAKKK